MTRRHAFRPDGLDLLEGRIAPSAFLAPGASTGVAAEVRAARVKAARAKAAQAKKSTVLNVDWNKVGNQIQNFLGLGHKSTPAKAHPAAAVGVVHPLRRG